MNIKSSLIDDYKTNPPGLVVKEPSQILFNFEDVTLHDPIESIQPDAQFLFANVKLLRFDFSSRSTPLSIKRIGRTIDQFEEINNTNSEIDSIELDLKDKVKDLDFKFLANYRIQKLKLSCRELTLSTFRHMQNMLIYVTELNLEVCKFGVLSQTAFEFCAQTLIKLDLSNTSAKSLKKGLIFCSLKLNCFV
jgi:hypothetical protein